MSATGAGPEREEPPRRLLAESGPVTGHLPAERRPARPLAAHGPPPARGLALWSGLSEGPATTFGSGESRGVGRLGISPQSHPRARTRGAFGALLRTPGRGFLNSVPPEVGPVGPSDPSASSQMVRMGWPPVRSAGKAA